MQVSSVKPAPADVAGRLHAAAIHLLRRLRRQDEAMGLTAARASALSVMVFGGPVTLGALAQAEQVSAPTVTRLIVGMERDGLVRREDDPDDGRVVWLRATPKGARLLHAGRRRRVAALAADLQKLDAAERDTLAAAVDILERMVTKLRLKPPSDDERSVRESSLRGGRCAAAKTASKASPAKTCFISPEHGFRRCLDQSDADKRGGMGRMRGKTRTGGTRR